MQNGDAVSRAIEQGRRYEERTVAERISDIEYLHFDKNKEVRDIMHILDLSYSIVVNKLREILKTRAADLESELKKSSLNRIR